MDSGYYLTQPRIEICFQPPPMQTSQSSPVGVAGEIPLLLTTTPPTPAWLSMTAHRSGRSPADILLTESETYSHEVPSGKGT